MYSEKTLKRFKEPKFSREMSDANAVGEVGNFKCGDIMRIYLKIENNKIKDISFQTYGCVAAIAATDAICEFVKGKFIDEALKVKYEDIVNELGDLPQIKHHCSVLGLNALKDAINKYKKGF